MSAGKGDKRRPQTVADEQFAERWDAIFGRCDTAEDVEKSIAQVNAEAMNSMGISAVFEGDEE
jgi:hypothetical protein